MKKKLLLFAVFSALLLWYAGSRLEGLSQGAKAEMEAEMSKWKEKVSLLKTELPANYVQYEVARKSYAACDKHLANFMFFLDNFQAEQAGEERDFATKECKSAFEKMTVQTQSKNESERFYAFYSLGNINVRRAMLALSAEEQSEALKEAIESYIAALQIRDDYEAKFNLELLISINEQARGAASKQLAPNDFKLNPRPHGASPGVGGKSKL